MLFALGCLVMASCSDDSTNDITANGLAVVSAKTSFSAAGGIDTIALAKPVIKAYAMDSWATVVSLGTNVTVTAALNTGRESRHTTVIVKSSEADSTIIDVDQAGATLKITAPAMITSNDDSKTLSYAASSTLPITITADSSWIVPSFDSDSVYVKLSANNEGHIRSGHLFISAGTFRDTITVNQMEFTKDIAGTYAIIDTYNSTDDNLVYQLAYLRDDNGQKNFVFPTLNLKLPITWSDDDMSVTINGGSLLGKVNDGNSVDYVYSVLGDVNQGYLTWSSQVSYTASLKYDAPDVITYGMFADNGSWAGYSVSILRFELFSTNPPSSSGRVGKAVVSLEYPELLRISSATSANSSKQEIRAKENRISTYIGRKNF
jgi:hypothetical protein